MFNSNTMSPADMAAITGNGNNMWGDGAMLWWIIIIICLFNGGFGWGNNAAGAAENYVLASDFATLQRQIDSTSVNTQNLITNNADQIQRQITAIGNGVSSLGYDQSNQMNGLNTAILNSRYDLSTQLNNIASNQQSCCCQTNNNITSGFADTNYRLATDTCAINTNIANSIRDVIDASNANYRALDAKLTSMEMNAKDDKIATLTADNQALKFAASQQAQNAYLVGALNPSAIPAYVVPNPNTGSYGGGCCCTYGTVA